MTSAKDAAALEIGRLVLRMIELAPAAGVQVGIKITEASDRDAGLAEDAKRLSPEGVAARASKGGIAQTRNSFQCEQYRRRRAAAKKGLGK